jgi:hypothetical protein
MNHPDDDTGDALRQLEADGDDLTRSRNIDFTVVFPSELSAEQFAKHFRERGRAVSVEFSEAEEGFPWDVTVVNKMTPSHAGITDFENVLQEVADPLEVRTTDGDASPNRANTSTNNQPAAPIRTNPQSSSSRPKRSQRERGAERPLYLRGMNAPWKSPGTPDFNQNHPKQSGLHTVQATHQLSSQKHPHLVRAVFISRARPSALCRRPPSIKSSHALMANGDKTITKNNEARSKSYMKGPVFRQAPVLRQAGDNSLAPPFKSTDAGGPVTPGLLHDNNQLTRIHENCSTGCLWEKRTRDF